MSMIPNIGVQHLTRELLITDWHSNTDREPELARASVIMGRIAGNVNHPSASTFSGVGANFLVRRLGGLLV
jgi:hypothetical protein